MENKKEGGEYCNCTVIHEANVKCLSEKIPEEGFFNGLADFFKVFGDPTRAKIIWALSNGEMCGCDLSALLGMTKSAVSHQLGYLRKCRLVTFRRDGKVVYYTLDDAHIFTIFESGVQHISE
ncbi:MAG: metalloregulator ArsR/SmtB family transcription factor [Clostridiaceae bacterium]|nr:metalloregulator ArsR/SmtB family transcription factor [Clostridiaceae bacterium]